MTILSYDGSFGGFLSCVFEVYERRLNEVSILATAHLQAQFFSEKLIIKTDPKKAKRVWDGLKKKLSGEGLNNIWYAFLSEMDGIENKLLEMIKCVFSSDKNIEKNYGNAAIIDIAQTARKVHREKHRMEAFVRFQLLKDGFFYAGIEPDFNVLPLILPHFKSRYADQNWLIYDIKRKYGIAYSHTSGKVNEVMIEWKEHTNPVKISGDVLSEDECFYQLLWKDYFKHTGIPERKNLKLHIQHVPKRYWKYLTEKS